EHGSGDGPVPTAVVTPRSPERDRTFGAAYPTPEPKQSYHLENAREFLDEPGEFYLDDGTGDLFYRPRPGEDLATSDVVAPALETVLDIAGTADSPAHHLRFEGLTFSHTDWLAPSEEGFVGIQAVSTTTGTMPGGIEVREASDIDFAGVTVRRMGSSGLNLAKGARAITIDGSRFDDLGGQGIAVDAALEPTESAATVEDVSITNNTITGVGQQFYGSPGIFVGYATGVRIEHNALRDLPYTAVSVGWGWSASDGRSKGHSVRLNEISNVMTLLDDGAGIYLLSNQPGTVVEQNYVHDLERSQWAGSAPVAGIYLDEGSSGMTIRGNVLVDVPEKVFLHLPGSGNTITDNDGTMAPEGVGPESVEPESVEPEDVEPEDVEPEDVEPTVGVMPTEKPTADPE
ncbi:MAG: right-handed parallel beta-helix repeat-containing protein, partial [Phycicoccus sp.]